MDDAVTLLDDPDTCSEDEDWPQQPDRYHRRLSLVLPWRSGAFDQFLTTLDTKIISGEALVGRRRGGSKPAPRERGTNLQVVAPAPTGLPVDCYVESWLNSLDSYQQEHRDIQVTPFFKGPPLDMFP